jgi:hypothetical protein
MNDASDLWQWAITGLHWDPAVLNMTRVVNNVAFMTIGDEADPVQVGLPPADYVNGVLGEDSLTRKASSTVSGSGDLVTFTFKVVGYGSSQISVESFTIANFAQATTRIPIDLAAVTYVGLPPPAPYSPTAIISNPVNDAFVQTGTTITLNGANSLPGFTGSAIIPIDTYSWTVSQGGFGPYNGAAPGGFTPTVAGDYVITLTVTAQGTPSSSTASVTVHVVAPALGSAVDVYTQRGGELAGASSDAFGPQEQVELYAKVTYNLVGVVNKTVTFEVRDKNGITVAYRSADTNDSGIAHSSFRLPWPGAGNPEGTFGTWSVFGIVDVSEKSVNDTTPFKFGYLLNITKVETQRNPEGTPAYSFPRSTGAPATGQMQVVVNVTNLASSVKSGKVCVTIYRPSSTVSLPIPRYAFVGNFKVYVSLVTALPSLGGVVYCPEYELSAQSGHQLEITL